MSDCRNPDARWLTAEITRCARHVDDTGLVPFVYTEAAVRYLALSPHWLECYRSPGGGPHFYKFETCRSGPPSGATIESRAKTLVSTDAWRWPASPVG